MPLKINLKDLPAATSAAATDKVLMVWGVDGQPRIIRVDQLGLDLSAVGGVLIDCEENGTTYQLSIVLVNGQPTISPTAI